MSANPELQIAAGITPAAAGRTLQITDRCGGVFKVACITRFRVRGWIQVGRSADEAGECLANRFHDAPRRDAGGQSFCIGRELRKVRIPTWRQFSRDEQTQFTGKCRILLFIGRKLLMPLCFRESTTVNGLTTMLLDRLWHKKWWSDRPPQVLLRQRDFLLPQRGAVRREGVLLMGRSIPDMRPHQDQ